MNLTNLFIILEVVGIAILLVEFLFVIFQPSSELQKSLALLLVTCIFAFIAYYFELRAPTKEEAMIGCVMGYVGKPFALLAVLYFIMEYTNFKHRKAIILCGIIFFVFLTTIVFTNDLHKWYYTSIDFKADKSGSGLILGHGVFWYVYMASTFIIFIFYSYLSFREFKKAVTKQAKQMAIYLFLMLALCILGLSLFLLRWTGGYDTTLTGTLAGSIPLFILLTKYRIFDSLTLAKERLLSDSENAVVVLDARSRVSYYNNLALKLIPDLKKITDAKFDENNIVTILNSIDQSSPIYFENKIFNLKTNSVLKKKRNGGSYLIGTTYEFVDITTQHNYQQKLAKDVEAATGKIKNMQREILASFAALVEARDGFTGQHIKNVSKYVRLIALELRRMGLYIDELTDSTIEILEEVAPLHDVGKVHISDSILGKPGKLTPEEFQIMKGHTLKGNFIIENTIQGIEEKEYVDKAKEIAMYHHERWDGTGYPMGLKGEMIPLSARIMAVADVYDALRMKRPYKEAFSKEKSVQIIKEESGTHFDPTIVDAFLNIVETIED